jgi:hypothetical protein
MNKHSASGTKHNNYRNKNLSSCVTILQFGGAIQNSMRNTSQLIVKQKFICGSLRGKNKS